jgi:hypothetical protein
MNLMYKRLYKCSSQSALTRMTPFIRLSRYFLPLSSALLSENSIRSFLHKAIGSIEVRPELVLSCPVNYQSILIGNGLVTFKNRRTLCIRIGGRRRRKGVRPPAGESGSHDRKPSDRPEKTETPLSTVWKGIDSGSCPPIVPQMKL